MTYSTCVSIMSAPEGKPGAVEGAGPSVTFDDYWIKSTSLQNV